MAQSKERPKSQNSNKRNFKANKLSTSESRKQREEKVIEELLAEEQLLFDGKKKIKDEDTNKLLVERLIGKQLKF